MPKGLLRVLPLLRALTDLLCPAAHVGLAAPGATGVVDSLSLISCPRLLYDRLPRYGVPAQETARHLWQAADLQPRVASCNTRTGTWGF